MMALGFDPGEHGSYTKLSNYLGISPQRLNKWKERDSISGEGWKLIRERCADLDFHWLITGERQIKEKIVSRVGDSEVIYEKSKEYERNIRLPDGTVIEEKRKIFKKPYMREICESVSEMCDKERYKILKIINILKNEEEARGE